MKCLRASLKTLTNSKKCYESRIKFLLGLPMLLLVDFSSVQYIHSRLSEQFSGSQVGFGTTTLWLTESWNKLSEEGYWKEFHN
jgi:hypothetical protein